MRGGGRSPTAARGLVGLERGDERAHGRSQFRHGSLDGVFIEELVRALSRHGVGYALVGGVAVNLHGVPRMTYDIDIVVRTDESSLRAVAEALGELGLRCRIPIALHTLADAAKRARLEAERNLIAVTFTDPADPLREVDILVAPSVDPDGVVARSVIRSAGTFEVAVANLVDLLRMKRSAGRPQDLADVVHLERLQRGSS